MVAWSSDWEQELTINRQWEWGGGGPWGLVGVMKMFANKVVVIFEHLFNLLKIINLYSYNG